MTKDEALKLALEALVTAEAGLADIGDADREPTDDLAWCEERAAQALAKPRAAITAIKEALAQPAQEPFGHFQYSIHMDAWVQNRTSNKGAAFYTAPQQRPWVGLTDEEIQDCYKAAYKVVQGRRLEVTFARAIEVKLKEKNT